VLDGQEGCDVRRGHGHIDDEQQNKPIPGRFQRRVVEYDRTGRGATTPSLAISAL